MSIAAYNITDILSSRPEARSSQPSGQSPYDIQNATAMCVDTRRGVRLLSSCHGEPCRPVEEAFSRGLGCESLVEQLLVTNFSRLSAPVGWLGSDVTPPTSTSAAPTSTFACRP